MRLSFSATIAKAIIAFTLTSPVYAQEKAGISGFRDIKFGMSLSDVREISSLNYVAELKNGAVQYKSLEGVSIAGKLYSQEFTFHNDELSTIWLIDHETEVLHAHCDLLYGTTLGNVQGIYGDWNGPANDMNFFGQTVSSRSKVFSDASQVKVSQLYISDDASVGGKCWINVIYTASQGSDTF